MRTIVTGLCLMALAAVVMILERQTRRDQREQEEIRQGEEIEGRPYDGEMP